MADLILTASAVLMMGALVLTGIRFFRGPTVADRTASFDTLTIISISVIAMLATFYGKGIFLAFKHKI